MLGRDEYKYIDGDRSLIAFIELLSGKPERAIHLSSIDKWLPPHEGERITEEERQQIANKIARALTRRGKSVTLWSGSAGPAGLNKLWPKEVERRQRQRSLSVPGLTVDVAGREARVP